MKLKIRNERIKEAIEFERRHQILQKSLVEGSKELRGTNLEEKAMFILLGYVSSLHEISEYPEVGIDIDLTYGTVQNVLSVVLEEFAAGMSPCSKYSLDENIEIAEKTIAAYFMFLAINDDNASLSFDYDHTFPNNYEESLAGIRVYLCSRLGRCNLLKEIHGSVFYTERTITIYVDRLIDAYKKITGKNLAEYGVEFSQGVFARK